MSAGGAKSDIPLSLGREVADESIPYADRYRKGRGQLADALPGGPKYTGALGKPFRHTSWWKSCEGCEFGAALVSDDGTVLDCWCEWLRRRPA